MAQKARFDAFAEGEAHGPYDEYPILPPESDLQICISHNDRPQPFHLMCEQDTVIVTMSGRGRVEFAEGPARYHTFEPGDFIYVPGGTAHRIVPDRPAVQLRYKAVVAGLEGVAWHCESCGTEIAREVWDTAEELPQEGYLRACAAFNEDAARRKCPNCGSVHAAIDLAPFRWADVAKEVRDDRARTAAKETAKAAKPAKAAG